MKRALRIATTRPCATGRPVDLAAAAVRPSNPLARLTSSRRSLHATALALRASSANAFQDNSTLEEDAPPTPTTPQLPGLGIDQVPLSDIQGPITPLSRYDQLVRVKSLRDDPHQRTIIAKLERLHSQLTNYYPPPIPASGGGAASSWFSGFGLFGGGKSHKPHPPSGVPRGMYLHGDVGCGKTMLMDLFYSTLPDHLKDHKKRIHFHAFMLDVFRRVHAIKHGLPSQPVQPVEAPSEIEGGLDQASLKKEIKSHIPLVKERIRAQRSSASDPMAGRSDERPIGVEAFTTINLFGLDKIFQPAEKRRMMAEEDAIYEVAREMAEEGRVLCFDEFQVTDIVTAMILRQLLERMMDYGLVCVITSNRHPDELYKNGLQRGSFLPCIDMIKDKFEIVDLDSKTDYRKLPQALSKVYFHPLNEEVRSEMSKLFTSQTSLSSSPITTDRTLTVWGRKLTVPESTETVARFPFEKLCGEPLSSADYLEITGKFEVIFVEDVPELGMDRKDMARRFITFIDACYENKTRLFISSQVPIFKIFGGDRNKNVDEVSAHMRSIMDDLGIAQDVVKSSAMFSGDEEFFAWARCVSRLTQMGTREWATSVRTK